MTSQRKDSVVLLIQCKDRRGIVARVSGFIHDFGGNILDSDHHTDEETNHFLMRMECSTEGLQIAPDQISEAFAPIAKVFEMRYEVHQTSRRTRVGMMVSKQDHCLADLLQRHRRDELRIDIPLIISNHDTCANWAELFKIPFAVCPVTKETKPEQERHVVSLLREQRIELVVMARYMQILSAEFLAQVGCPVINIHHSFLPAFIGANPYRQAYERGVKIIGATAHYATQDLDEGPIIEQDVIRVGHRDTVDDLVRKGRDLEEIVLARAVRRHIERRVLVYGRKTVVFD
ncbi:MAG: formyltetrahydrofolate deformylase [Nitrospiraceae bacterium]|jgi:formyltetrahydrofolate deformylase|uniref:formyltetrahydrofolate deformylase n=1 Tax=Nitrospira cf. moscoviensis SBR1015 TaxID=96242 RepID=UPI000A0D1C8B|nr:formyltetrahydrofolate deformylase [Nitrospira cf. moscoviensis SBR1015]MBY0248105.1 formyltetrahydrofolate deformylase [Nitrospiraceae bacterium]OQW31432.1 MAG: formyltetrahydrofolate deformylase [Nitrospira sp. SG-bin2]